MINMREGGMRELTVRAPADTSWEFSVLVCHLDHQILRQYYRILEPNEEFLLRQFKYFQKFVKICIACCIDKLPEKFTSYGTFTLHGTGTGNNGLLYIMQSCSHCSRTWNGTRPMSPIVPVPLLWSVNVHYSPGPNSADLRDPKQMKTLGHRWVYMFGI